MRHEYKCPECNEVTELCHKMTDSPEVSCPRCQTKMYRRVVPPAMIHMTGSGLGARSLLSRDRPSGREYRAYQAWEESGGEPGTPEHRQFLIEKGEVQP